MKLRILALRWETFLLLVLAVVLLLGAQASDHFLTASNISIALAGMMPVAIVALPMTLVVVTGQIDISVGSIIGLCASVMGVCLEHHLPVGLAMASGLAIGTLAGLFNGILSLAHVPTSLPRRSTPHASGVSPALAIVILNLQSSAAST